MRHQKSAGNRLPEKWFRRGLWLIAFIFASFLIGLGGKVINDLPSVEQTRELDDYMGEKGILLQQTRDRLNERIDAQLATIRALIGIDLTAEDE